MGKFGDILKLICTSEDDKKIPHPTEPIVDKRYPKDVIQYKERVFEVPHEEINYLSNLPSVLEKTIHTAKEKGMFHMYPDGSYACWYCEHYADNPLARVIQAGEMAVNERNEAGCKYEPNKDIKLTSLLKNTETKIVVMAQKRPCVVNDATITALMEEKKLDEYEVFNKKFDYPTLSELDESKELQEKFRVRSVENITD
jgi:hypothetical protein